jgi:hypothetical protein
MYSESDYHFFAALSSGDPELAADRYLLLCGCLFCLSFSGPLYFINFSNTAIFPDVVGTPFFPFI